MTAIGIHLYQKYPERVPLWIPVSFVTLCASGLMILLITQILIFGRVPAVAEPALDYVIVLGSKVHPDGAVSKTLKLRLDKAIEYAGQNPETLFILSGAKGENEPCTEASAMKQYFLEHGVEEERILLEEQSFSTVENLAYSKLVIERQEVLLKQEQELLRAPKSSEAAKEPAAAARPIRIGILTSNFHLCRASFIAKKQKYENAYGIASESDKVLLVHFALRDGIALLKDRLMGNL